MTVPEWIEESVSGTHIFRPSQTPPHLVVAFSGRGSAPDGSDSPTAFLARRFAEALNLPEIPIVRARQVHGNEVVTVHGAPPPGAVRDAGERDILVTPLPSVALVVQSADCVPLALVGSNAIGVAHAGWRGSAKNAAAAAVAALARLGEASAGLSAWIGPAIGPCCYDVGKEVAAQFGADFFHASSDGRYRLDLRAVNRAQLEAAGLPGKNILIHPACTKCGGEKFASYRRDGAAAGRMIGLAARIAR